VVRFDGFLRSTRKAATTSDDEDGRRLPRWPAATGWAWRRIAAEQHFTEPPPRYSEAPR
jgi:DNA topoisomerase I